MGLFFSAWSSPGEIGNHPDLVVTVKKMKQIYIIEMACPSWRGRADREELKTMKYNLERHRDFKANQSNIKVDVLEGYMNSVWSWRDFSGRVLYVCMFVCLFFLAADPRENWNSLAALPLPKMSHGFTDCFVWRLRSCPFGKRSLPFVKHLDLLLRVFLLKTRVEPGPFVSLSLSLTTTLPHRPAKFRKI